MITSRYYHACGKFKMGDQMVLIVAGGYNLDSVEFFPLNETNWITGNAFIYLIKITFVN